MMRRFTVAYTFRKDKHKHQPESKHAECVQWSDGSVYMNGDLYPGDFTDIQDFEKTMTEHYDTHKIEWIDAEVQA